MDHFLMEHSLSAAEIQDQLIFIRVVLFQVSHNCVQRILRPFAGLLSKSFMVSFEIFLMLLEVFQRIFRWTGVQQFIQYSKLRSQVDWLSYLLMMRFLSPSFVQAQPSFRSAQSLRLLALQIQALIQRLTFEGSLSSQTFAQLKYQQQEQDKINCLCDIIKFDQSQIPIKTGYNFLILTCYELLVNIQLQFYLVIDMAQSQNPNVKVTFSEEDTRKYYEEQKLRMMPLVKFLKKNGLKFKHAACQGARVEYFRMDSLQEILDNKKEQLAQHPTLSPLVQKLNDELYYFKRPENSQKLRFPQTLAPSRTGSGKFAAFKFDTTESKRIYFFAVLIAIVAFVLFPLWPYALKYALWIASVVLLVILVSIILLRLVLYTILASFGVSFWLFPNLFGDYSIMDSLRPLYTIQKWQNDIFSIILRVLSFAIFVYYCHSIYVQPEFYLENFESAKEIVKDVHDWGVDKINGQAGNFSQRALTMDKIINQTADAFQTQKNHYTSFEAPVEQETVDSEAAEEKTDGGQPGQEDYEDQKQKEFVNKPQDQQQQQLQEV